MAGLRYLPVGVAMFVGARVAGGLTVRLGPRRATVLFTAIGAAGLLGLAPVLWGGGSLVAIAGPVIAFGFGTAAAFTPLTVSATAGVHSSRAGVAAGVLNTVRQTSGAAGLAALTAVVTIVASSGDSDPRAALAHGYSVAFAVCAGCVVLAGVVAALAMPRTGASEVGDG